MPRKPRRAASSSGAEPALSRTFTSAPRSISSSANCSIAAIHRQVQRGVAGIIGRLEVGAVGQQQFHHGEIVLDAGVGQRLGAAFGVPRVDAGAMLDQVASDLEVAAPGGIVQRSGAHLVALR